MRRRLCVLLVVWVAGFLLVPRSGAVFAETPQTPPGPPPLATEGPKPPPAVPPSREEIDRAIRRGVDFLLLRQNRDGSWGSPHNTKGLNIYAPVPGAHQAFRAAVTSLCVAALIDVKDSRSEVQEAIDRGEAWLIANLPKVRRATPDAIYNNWAHAYSLQALTRLIRRHKGDPAKQAVLREVMETQLDRLIRYECVNGGWAYYDFDYGTQKPGGSTISFVTATVLVAFHEAQQVGLKIPEKLIDRAKASILRQRKPDYTYCYGEYLKMRPLHPVNMPAGSLGRSQACNLAMRLWGDTTVTDDVLRTWLDRFFARDGWLDLGRKRPIPHESFFAIAGYFFYYGHYYASLCIGQLPESERPDFYGRLAAILLPLQEKDGSWWDFPFYDYHQQYGTAFALLALAPCRASAPSRPAKPPEEKAVAQSRPTLR
ncbi:MAG: terpene cyclase/mutase family protein [Thermogutta sp.]|uniref:prenyltransferase/squalene oxidase repeat-containing protein n=1 Tax=Thermogutta sp. TaxID=1962930 RepID=UPI0019BDFF3E|nr:prenyltransferase/squalene oxidase repeat-containing protein [Thermogutta sp.]MBC7352588.1 terpene cyclase/mutase family protein [Thermogutta sp.]